MDLSEPAFLAPADSLFPRHGDRILRRREADLKRFTRGSSALKPIRGSVQFRGEAEDVCPSGPRLRRPCFSQGHRHRDLITAAGRAMLT